MTSNPVPTVWELTRDIEGRRYHQLIQTLIQSLHSFSLVWRDQLKHADTAQAIRRTLRHLQICHNRTDRWPGTRIFGTTASVIKFTCDSSAIPILSQPRSLFSWLTPQFPEDLVFWNASGQPVLATVSHETEGWILDHTLAGQLGQIVLLKKLESLTTDNLDTMYGR